MYLCKFGGSPPTDSEGRAQNRSPKSDQLFIVPQENNRYIEISQNLWFGFGLNLTFQSTGVTLKIRSWSPKFNQHL